MHDSGMLVRREHIDPAKRGFTRQSAHQKPALV
jgi:hypothetical protein